MCSCSCSQKREGPARPVIITTPEQSERCARVTAAMLHNSVQMSRLYPPLPRYDSEPWKRVSGAE